MFGFFLMYDFISKEQNVAKVVIFIVLQPAVLIFSCWGLLLVLYLYFMSRVSLLFGVHIVMDLCMILMLNF